MSDGTRRVWTCDELLSTEELAAEGRIMSHCVVTYVRLCAAGRASIWSMSADSGDGADRRLTVQVRADGTIIQARGLRNARPTPVQRRVLARWAREARLVIAEWV